MCGITGIYHSREPAPIDQALLKRMTDRLSHRGPDGDGFHVGPGIGLGHRRLAIIDLVTGDCPVYSADRGACIVFNGEIYNFKDIRSELQARGHRFHTQGDTEVILQAWLEWGPDAVRRLRGMFAFAIWDERRQTLFLARDRVGKKPLYYSLLADGRLIFASELKALLAVPALARRLDPRAIEDYMAYGYVPEGRAIYRGVAKLAPGHYLELPRGAQSVAPVRYWRLALRDGDPRDEAATAIELADRLRQATDIRRVSDVPLGAFLSGGVDSSGVVAMMAQCSPEPVQTFSIAFKQKEYDESGYAAAHARRYGTDHHCRTVDADAFDLVDRLATIYDEPFGDSSAIPTFRVSAVARERVTVALSGDGGDEFFAGYRRYLWHLNEERVRRALPAGVRRALFGLLGRAYPRLDWAPRSLRAKTTFQELALDPTSAYFLSVSRVSDAMRDRIYSADFKRELAGYHAMETIETAFAEADCDHPLLQAQYADAVTWLPGDILVKVDRAAMANSLEVRAPLLDHELIEWSAGLAAGLKLRGRTGKYILKKALEPYVRDDILYRPKMGFSVPLAAWFRGPLRSRIRQSLGGERLGDSGLFDLAALADLVEQHQSGRHDHATVLWSVLMFDSFLRQVHDQDAPDRESSATAPLAKAV